MPATAMVVAGIAIVVLAVLLLYNGLVRRRNRVEAAWADLDVQLSRRWSLLPNLITTVAAYASHERAVAVDAAALRSVARRENDVRARADAEAAIDGALDRLVAVAEAYPQLRADERFAALIDELVATENKVAFSRQLYNDTVQRYRTALESFPGVLLAPLLSAPPDFFTAGPDERPAGSVARLHAGTADRVGPDLSSGPAG